MPSARDEAVRNLLVSLLAVNNYSLEKVWQHIQAFEQEGIFDPSQVCAWSKEEATQHLAHAGYRRGSFMNPLIAERLVGVCRFLEEGGLNALMKACENRRIEEVADVLKDVRGVGPFVIRNFSILMNWV